VARDFEAMADAAILQAVRQAAENPFGLGTMEETTMDRQSSPASTIKNDPNVPEERETVPLNLPPLAKAISTSPPASSSQAVK
jgi:hypothetical protein